jgi:hypothetical protein
MISSSLLLGLGVFSNSNTSDISRNINTHTSSINRGIYQENIPTAAIMYNDVNYTINTLPLVFYNNSMLETFFAGNESTQDGTKDKPYQFNEKIFGDNPGGIGLRLFNCSSYIIINNSLFFDLNIGIEITQSSNIQIINSTFFKNLYMGIRCINSTDLQFTQNRFESIFGGIIAINGLINGTFSWNNFTNVAQGIELENIKKVYLTKNRFINNSQFDILVNTGNEFDEIMDYHFYSNIGLWVKGIIGTMFNCEHTYFRACELGDIIQDQTNGNTVNDFCNYHFDKFYISVPENNRFIFNNTVMGQDSHDFPNYYQDFNITTFIDGPFDAYTNLYPPNNEIITYWDVNQPESKFQYYFDPLVFNASLPNNGIPILNQTENFDILDYIIPKVSHPTTFMVTIEVFDIECSFISQTFSIIIENDLPEISVNSTFINQKVNHTIPLSNQAFKINVSDMLNSTDVLGNVQILERVNGNIIHYQTTPFNTQNPTFTYKTPEGNFTTSKQLTEITFTPDSSVLGLHEIEIIATDGFNGTSRKMVYALVEELVTANITNVVYIQQNNTQTTTSQTSSQESSSSSNTDETNPFSIDYTYDPRYLIGGASGLVVGLGVSLAMKKR